MPNTRRRRFSVQNDTQRPKSHRARGASNNSYKSKSALPDHAGENCVQKNKTRPNSSNEICSLNVSDDHESSASLATTKQRSTATLDKDVAASSSNIDLYHYLRAPENASVASSVTLNGESETNCKQNDSLVSQHRIKVRSPKRCAPTIDDTEQAEGRSLDAEEMCRICHGAEGALVAACRCRGTVGRVHVRCLERWLTEAAKSRCELCGARYHTQRVHRYGLARAMLVWLLSHSAKQLLVDGLGLALMSPLAVLAAWLSGRTLSSLMAQDPRLTPWPLASTFVLACMTLVCYYCWVVSAATRHALSWWVWYRAQYEVRLQLDQDLDDS
ncbi:uncharacterized protein LOC114253168 [Bombyx mandarina]|uniref:RING-CH-type domain-containing protein n=2 Tax=Bombyx TaxID=7090 RepID=A0A8R1WH85_BOMMO|nr:uncharacterized protein LOC101745364 [Bombyx mori]XP_028043730.1 uncharacterized protein LOC114253168 [Bombyx mandarina]